LDRVRIGPEAQIRATDVQVRRLLIYPLSHIVRWDARKADAPSAPVVGHMNGLSKRPEVGARGAETVLPRVGDRAKRA
jgi:hypothetical protein